jgi:S-adenosylmethionine/arginine decarboxylase-like enzyme
MIEAGGYHLILNAKKCVPYTIRSAPYIRDFSKRLVKEIDMIPYKNPQVVMFGTGNKQGYTLVQLIETSNITAHFVEETNAMYLDVFSCKQFDKEVVEKIVQETFDPKIVDTRFLLRI